VIAENAVLPQRVPPVVWLLCLTLLTAAALYADHVKFAGEILWQSHSVATGHAQWRVYQNRILGPFLVQGISLFLRLDYGVAFMVFVVGTMFAANVVAYYTLHGGGRYRTDALRYCALLNAAFLAVQVRPFLYEWDCVDLIVFHLLVLGAVARRSAWFFTGVFLLELLNREAATFVGLYVAVDGVLSARQRGDGRAGWGRVALGVAMCVVGAVVTEKLRARFLIGVARDAAERTIVLGQHWQLRLNLAGLSRPGLYKSYWLPWIVIGSSAVVWSRFQALRGGALALGVTYGALTVSLVLFAVLQETRVLIPYIPLLLLLTLKQDHLAFLRSDA
jgi:hypothetical protein